MFEKTVESSKLKVEASPGTESRTFNIQPSTFNGVRARHFGAAMKAPVAFMVAAALTTASRAHAYMGDQLLQTASTYFIAPLFILSVVTAGVASIFRPEMIRTAAYSAIISLALFGVIKLAQPLMSAVAS